MSSEAVEFSVDDTTVRGTFSVPVGAASPVPVVVMAHGWAMVASGDLQDYAESFQAAGLATLTFDFRHLGRSDGTPRQEIDPHRQVEDFRTAVTWVLTRPEVDPAKVGIWGSSYSGGHALTVAAQDDRVAAVVAQVPTISGYRAARDRWDDATIAAQQARFDHDRQGRLRGREPLTIPLVSPDPTAAAVAYPGPDSYAYMSAEGRRCPEWQNFVTVRSLELARSYEPGLTIERIAPKPLLMIVAADDVTTPADLQLEAYERAQQPKELLVLPGGHYSVYTDHLHVTRRAAADWFARHLLRPGRGAIPSQQHDGQPLEDLP
ncbi:hypothetical protein CLV37_1225 [Kineococcus rhizosphaerae]|uniref:Xaa-Pro dipeptidyl-peptidase-like domain-containing protein n=1 Tax=Kineococcus rhizosphaerae TaxID=559628 RepID=A0A2T0QUV4_9ACTN|nr:alpha/beta hydrolase [Kineococcus rhizosphaerae]PRY08928.1 hypothetical protein CLV37_1225 [Kineococcus rhizosphaerae]